MTIKDIKQFSHIDYNDDDTLLQGLLTAAQLYLINAGVNVNTSELYNLAVKLLVGHWYDNRSVIGKADKIAFSLDCIIEQLKYADVDYNEAVIKLITLVLTLNDDPVTAVNTAYDIINQHILDGGTV